MDWLVLGVGPIFRGGHAEPAASAGYVSLTRLSGFDATPGPDNLEFPDFVVRQHVGSADVRALRWMVNPTDALAPRLPKGGLLLVDPSVTSHKDVIDGETYVIRMWGRVNVRRIFIIGQNEYRLRGDKELEGRRDLTGPDYKHLEIGGRVVDVI